MAIAKSPSFQNDFSAGELDPSAKRAEIAKVGVRQMANMRITSAKSARNRPGRSLQMLITQAFTGSNTARVEKILVGGSLFYLCFFGGGVAIFDTNGHSKLASTSQPWSFATINQIMWAPLGNSLYVTFPGMKPLIMVYDGANWSAGPFAFYIKAGGQVRAPFYRLSPQNITMLPSATSGNITLTFSSPLLGSGHTNTRMRFCQRQVLITHVNSTVSANATVLETLPPGQVLSTTTDPRVAINIGDEAKGGTSNARGLVTALTAGTITVQLLTASVSVVTAASGGGTDSRDPNAAQNIIGFVSPETVSGPGGSVILSGVAVTTPQAVSVWDDELINDFRGWPERVSTDQRRLIFNKIPALLRGILWSAIDTPGDCYPDAPADSAMLELVPAEANTVEFVLPGAESSEFVFCSNRIYYIPISVTNPLRPGSVAFNIISTDGCYPVVQPRGVQDVILYIGAGGNAVNAIVATGAYNRPYQTRNLSELHSHLIHSPVVITAPNATGQFEERYFYVLNSDGSITLAKYQMEDGQIKGTVGMLPWSCVGVVNWVSSYLTDVVFSTNYTRFLGATIEIQDATQYLDGAMLVNSPPPNLVPQPGQGPLWFIPGGTVTLLDQGTRQMGTYQVDNNGNIVPQNIGGENLHSTTLVAGFAWDATLEPFVPPVQHGQDSKARMRKRRVSRVEIYVKDSTGFRMDTIYAEQQGTNLPAPGTVVKTHRVPSYNQDDDPTQPPRQFERAYAFKPTGRAHDPRVVFVKDTPGPWEPLEIDLETTV